MRDTDDVKEALDAIVTTVFGLGHRVTAIQLSVVGALGWEHETSGVVKTLCADLQREILEIAERADRLQTAVRAVVEPATGKGR